MLRVRSSLCRTRRVSRLAAGVAASAAVFSAGLTLVAGTGTAASAATYVAMGDSYTSGPKIPTQSSAAGGCDRSNLNYPSDVAAALKLTFTDVSCSGATTANILNTTQDVSPGPDNPPQLGAVGSGTQIVSLQIGGDDLGFTNIIENCAALTPWGPTKVGANCRNYYDPNGNNSLANAVTALAQPIRTILDDIHNAAAPNAKVFVLGYPDILPENGACWPSMPFETADAEYLNSVEQDLNTMLQETAAANGATFVNTYTPSESHNACTSESTRWVEPIVPASPADPVHPNANGEAAMANELEQVGI